MSVSKLSPEDIRKHKGVSFVGVVTTFLMYTKDGEFFMAKRSKNARDEHGKWEIQGGGLKLGKTLEENVVCEMEEESNTKPIKMEFLGHREVFRNLGDGTPTHWIAMDFAVLVDKAEVKINETDIFDDSGWFTLANQPSPVHSQHKELIAKYRNRLETLLKID